MTKPCKACKEQIEQGAWKCPKCQAWQRWYRNPQMISLLIVPLFLLLLFASNTSRPRNPVRFADYKDKFSVSVVGETPSANARSLLLTVRLENRTDKTWRRPTFQVESLSAGDKILTVEHANEYNLVVGPNSSALATLTLRLASAEPVARRTVTLTEIDWNRY